MNYVPTINAYNYARTQAKLAYERGDRDATEHWQLAAMNIANARLADFLERKEL